MEIFLLMSFGSRRENKKITSDFRINTETERIQSPLPIDDEKGFVN